MKKIKYISLLMLLAFALMGAAFAAWSDTVNLGGTVDTGYVEVGVSEGSSDDTTLSGSNDPLTTGTADKNVASNDVTAAGKNFNSDITNGYPDYMPTATFTINNNGTVPVKLAAPVLTGVPVGVTVVVTAADDTDIAGKIIDVGGTLACKAVQTVTDDAAQDIDVTYSGTIVATQWNK